MSMGNHPVLKTRSQPKIAKQTATSQSSLPCEAMKRLTQNFDPASSKKSSQSARSHTQPAATWLQLRSLIPSAKLSRLRAILGFWTKKGFGRKRQSKLQNCHICQALKMHFSDWKAFAKTAGTTFLPQDPPLLPLCRHHRPCCIGIEASAVIAMTVKQPLRWLHKLCQGELKIYIIAAGSQERALASR